MPVQYVAIKTKICLHLIGDEITIHHDQIQLQHTRAHGTARWCNGRQKQFGFESAAHLTSFLSSNGGDDISLFKANLEVQGCLFTMHPMFFQAFPCWDW